MGYLDATIKRIGPLDEGAMAQARARQASLTKPPGSLGRLEELSVLLAGIARRPLLQIRHKAIIVMVGDHGVVAEGVSAYPQEVTAQMVFTFLRGGAAINVLARHTSARVVVVDIGVKGELEDRPGLLRRKVAPGTRNMRLGAAMSREEAIQAIEVGIEVLEGEVEKGLDLVGTGGMGIGNTTPASAVTALLTGLSATQVTGRGTGIDEEKRLKKVKVIEEGIALNCPDPRDPIDVLAKVGGLEIAGLVGVILGAAAHRVPILIDGFISTAAALVATDLAPQARPYLIASHRSAEMGHRPALHHLGLEPLFDLGLRLGEGTGAALGFFIMEAAARLLAEMATFEEAGVSQAL